MRKMKKMIAGCAAVLTIAALAGCSLGENTASTTAAKDPEKTSEAGTSTPEHIGLIYPTLSNEFLAQQADSVKTLLEERGCKVELVSSDDDSTKELQQLENFASMGVDTIMIFPIGATAGEVGNTLQKLRDQGIRVTVVGNQVSLGTFDTMMLVNQEDVGKSVARLAADWIEETFPDAEDGSIEVAIVETTTSVESKAASSALYQIEEMTSKAKVVETFDQPFGEQITKVQDAIDVMLFNHPRIKVILTYDEPQALAANEKIMGKGNIDKATFGIFGSGISQASLTAIKDSVTNKTVLRGTNAYGFVDEMVKAVLGEIEVDSDNIFYSDIVSITAENAEEFMN